jgi:hypothetical protein
MRQLGQGVEHCRSEWPRSRGPHIDGRIQNLQHDCQAVFEALERVFIGLNTYDNIERIFFSPLPTLLPVNFYVPRSLGRRDLGESKKVLGILVVVKLSTVYSFEHLIDLLKLLIIILMVQLHIIPLRS